MWTSRQPHQQQPVTSVLHWCCTCRVVGFDPLRLGTNPENLKWYREGELTNGRWAMAAVAGILFTDLVGLPKFWLAGAEVSSSCQAAAVRQPQVGADLACTQLWPAVAMAAEAHLVVHSTLVMVSTRCGRLKQVWSSPAAAASNQQHGPFWLHRIVVQIFAMITLQPRGS